MHNVIATKSVACVYQKPDDSLTKFYASKRKALSEADGDVKEVVCRLNLCFSENE